MTDFPAPVGGTPLPADTVPSAIAVGLYGLLLPLVFYRWINRRSRTILLVGASILSIERTIFFILRILESRSDSMRFSHGLTVYAQNSLAIAFIGIANDTAHLLRCLLVNSTYGSEMYFQSPSAVTQGCFQGPPPPNTPDEPKTRKKIRISMSVISIGFLTAIITGVIANADYSQGLTDQSKADTTARFRIISSGLVPLVALGLVAFLFQAIRSQRIPKRGVKICAAMTALSVTVALYRLAVVNHKVDSLSAPSPLNSTSAKAAFYIFHVLPEWLAALLVFAFNMRQTFGTGPRGDWRYKDEIDKQRGKGEFISLVARDEGGANRLDETV